MISLCKKEREMMLRIHRFSRLIKVNGPSNLNYGARWMATEKIVKTPSMGESITEGTLTQWMKSKEHDSSTGLNQYSNLEI